MKHQPPTILVVDDEQIIRELLQEALTDAGYRVLTADNAEDACRMTQESSHSIVLILMDIILTGSLNGLQLGEQLSKLGSAPKIIYMSGSTTNQQQFDRFILKPDRGFLAKPFTISILLDMIEGLLG